MYAGMDRFPKKTLPSQPNNSVASTSGIHENKFLKTKLESRLLESNRRKGKNVESRQNYKMNQKETRKDDILKEIEEQEWGSDEIVTFGEGEEK